jgi:hypothetical protein
MVALLVSLVAAWKEMWMVMTLKNEEALRWFLFRCPLMVVTMPLQVATRCATKNPLLRTCFFINRRWAHE